MTADERIELINKASTDIVTAIGIGLRDAEMDRGDADIVFRGVRGLATIITVFNVAIVELSESVGKLAALAEKDMNAQIQSEAEAVAEGIAKDKTKRSFIGQK